MTSQTPAAAATPRGLTSADVEERVQRGEVNHAPPEGGRGYTQILRENVFSPVNVVLFAISAALVILGLPGDALMTGGLVLLNVVIGVFQEARAKRRLSQISLLVQPTAMVIRDGAEQSISPAEIVRDDLVVISQGDEVPVDGKLVQSNGLAVDESLLTGESDYVSKRSGDDVSSGSYVTAGSGLFTAERLGADTTARQITSQARALQKSQTPLQREISLVILGMAIVVALLTVTVLGSLLKVRGEIPIEDALRAGAVTIALVPQGLAFMITIGYARGALRMAGNGALVQRLNAIETMSHVDIVCVDKTGTLTTNTLKLEALSPIGIAEDELRRLLGAYVASAAVSNRTAAAIAADCPADPQPVAREVAFDSTRKWGALAFDTPALSGLYVLGAPEALESHLAQPLETPMDDWLAEGLRVLLFAHGATTALDDDTLPSDLTPLGLVVLRDELRPEAASTVARFGEAGIGLKVISGDNPETVASLARQVGIESESNAVAGSELAGLTPDELAALAEQTTIFGRITPADKQQIVGALGSKGRYLAMIGDGVNDIPAMKRASVSVAMRSGTPATRAVADIILLNDSFAALPAAFEEGQRIRNGMQASIRLFLTRTLSLSLIILVASLLGDPFPTTPRQASIPAFLAVGLPALILVFTAPAGRTEPRVIPASIEFVVGAALTIGIAGAATYHGFWLATDNVLQAQTALVLVQLTIGVALIPYARRLSQNAGLRGPDPALALFAVAMFLPVIACLEIAPLRDFLELERLTLAGYAIIALSVAVAGALLHLLWRWRPLDREGD